MGAISSLLPTVFASFGTFVLALGLAFCWYHWTFVRPYRHFPSVRTDVRCLFKVIMGRYPKDVSFTNAFTQDLLKSSRSFYREGLYVNWIFRPYLVICNDYFMKTLYNEAAVVEKSPLYDVLKEFFGDSLLGSKEDLWKVHRKMLNPAFHLGVLKGYMQIFNQNGEDLVEKLQSIADKPSEDTLDILKKTTFSIMAASVLGLNLSDEMFGSRFKNFLKMIDKTAELAIYRIPRPWLHWNFLLPFFSAGRSYKEGINNIHGFTHEIVEELRKSVSTSEKMAKDSESEVEVRKSLAHILIEQHLQDTTFTMDQVRDHVVNFMSAGYDTSAFTLMWCLYVLGHHPEVQKEACEEIDSVVMGEDVTYEDVCKLKFLDCVIKETLRLYPTIPLYVRKLTKETQCGQYSIPKDTNIVFTPFMLHRNPDIYPDPEKFIPERFSDNSDVRPWMHVPFAEGYRSCIGKKFAMMEMKVLLTHVLRRFEIRSLNTVEDSDLDCAVILRSAKPLRMLFKARLPES